MRRARQTGLTRQPEPGTEGPEIIDPRLQRKNPLVVQLNPGHGRRVTGRLLTKCRPTGREPTNYGLAGGR
jgi:hypothetical protein